MELFNMLGFQIFNGIVWGLVIALLAVGLNMVYGILNVVNVAHGALYMAGAYICWYVFRLTGNFGLGVFTATVLTFVIGITLERIFFRKLNDHYLTIVLTVGFMFILQDGVSWLFGANVRSVTPSFTLTIEIFGQNYPVYRVVVAVISLVLLGGLSAIIHFTRLGLWMRAVKYDPITASGLGVPTSLVLTGSFGLGVGLAGFAGGLVSPLVSVFPDMGMEILVTVFLVVVVGGLGDLLASALVAILFSVINGVAITFVEPQAAWALTLAIMGTFLIIAPDGLGTAFRTSREKLKLRN